MVRPTYVDSKGMKKGAWTEEEDNKLRAYIQRYGHWNWRLLPKYAGLARCGKSCRLRWVNYLKPGTKHGNFSKHEEDLIIQLHNRLGNRWSAIAAELPGRTDNEIKNFWHTNIKKRDGRNVDAIQPENMIKEQINGKTDQVVFCEEEQLPSPMNPFHTTTQILNESNYLNFSTDNVLLPYGSTPPASVEQSSDNLWPDSNSPPSVAQYSDNLWAEAFLDDTSYNQNVYNNFPPLQEDHEIFNSGLIQEPYYGEYLSSFDYSIPNSFDWNQADDVLDTSQSELTYNFSSQEEAGEIYDHCFQYLDDGMGLFELGF